MFVNAGLHPGRREQGVMGLTCASKFALVALGHTGRKGEAELVV